MMKSTTGFLRDYRRRIVLSSTLFVLPIGFVCLAWFLPELPIKDPGAAARTFTNLLERLPTEPTLYIVLSALLGVWLSGRWIQYDSLCKAFNDKEESEGGLTKRDWWVVRGLRQRALALRTRADLILGGVFVLLFGGIYLVMFILPQIEVVA